MIRKSFLDVIMNDEKSEGVEISISKVDFPTFIHDYIPNDLTYPSEEECKRAYLEVTNKKEGDKPCIEDYNFNYLKAASNIVQNLSFTLQECYTLDNNEFDYICDSPKRESFLQGEDLGVKELEAVFYYYNYLKGKIGVSGDAITKHDYPFSKDLKQGVVECKQFIARATLYKEAFEKLGEKDALSFCNDNIYKAKVVLPLAMFMSKVWDNMLNDIEFCREYYE